MSTANASDTGSTKPKPRARVVPSRYANPAPTAVKVTERAYDAPTRVIAPIVKRNARPPSPSLPLASKNVRPSSSAPLRRSVSQPVPTPKVSAALGLDLSSTIRADVKVAIVSAAWLQSPNASASPGSSSVNTRVQVGSKKAPLATAIDKEKLKHISNEYRTLLLQWCFVNARAKHAFEAQQEQALLCIFDVHNQIQQRREQLFSRKLELQSQLFNTAVARLLRNQYTEMPSVSLMSDLRQAHDAFIEALYTSMHHMPVEGLRINLEELSYELQVSLRTLTCIKEMLEAQVPKIGKYAESIQSLHTTTHQELAALSQCREVLLAITMLENMERSLRAQLIQISYQTDIEGGA